MLREVLVHLKHGHLLLAEHRLQLGIRQDLAPVLRVLQLVLLDVGPDLAHYLAARQGPGSDHRRQLLGRLQRLLQRVGLLTTTAGVLLRSCLAALGFGRHGRPPSRWVPSEWWISWPAPPGRCQSTGGRTTAGTPKKPGESPRRHTRTDGGQWYARRRCRTWVGSGCGTNAADRQR